MTKDQKTPEKDVKTPNASKKNSVIIDINPQLESVNLLKFDTVAVVSFLAMSPPTKAHDAFVEALWDIASSHSVEQPLLFIKNTSNDYGDDIKMDDTGETEDEEDDNVFYWLDPEDAQELATEAYGESLVQRMRHNSLSDVVNDIREKFTEIVLVLPEEEADKARAIFANDDDIEIISYPDLDESDEAAKMYNLAMNDVLAFTRELAEGIDYLVDEIVELYSLFTMDTENYTEALNYAQRVKRAQIFRRNKRKIAIARDRMKRKIATTDQLKARARKYAIKALRKKLAGKRGLDYANLAVGEKINIDKRVEQRKGAIGRIAQKILPQLRKQELQKMSKNATPKNESFNLEDLPNNMARPVETGDGSSAPVTSSDNQRQKRSFWHMVHNPDGSVKFDKRFKIWRNVHDVHEAVEAIESVMENDDVQAIIESLLQKAEEYNIEPDVIKEVFNRGVVKGSYDNLTPVQEGFQRVNSFIAGNYFLEDLDLMERAEENACAIITQAELKELEKFADALLDKFGIDIAFTKHFGERMSDSRNSPCITVKELRDFFRKIAMKQGKPIKDSPEDQVVLKDLQTKLNLPVVINYNRGKFDVILKTIMRKSNFTSSNPIVNV